MLMNVDDEKKLPSEKKLSSEKIRHVRKSYLVKKQARKLQATLVRNYESLTHSLTYSQGWGVELLA